MKQEIRVWETPYAQVAKAFEIPWDPTKERGGCPVGRTPYLNNQGYSPIWRYSDDYHVESSFTDEQRPYVTAALTCLNFMAQGRIIESDEQVSAFAERIQSNISQADNLFPFAVAESFLQLVGDFGKRYPNLMPALSRQFEVAGKEGYLLVERETAYFWADASKGNLTFVNLDAHYPDITRARFIMPHPFRFLGDQKPVVGSEVWCAGEALSIELTRQARIAAVCLVASGKENKLKWYGPTDAYERLDKLVESLSQRAKQLD